MNLCMVQDGKGNVLALDKVNDSYTGTTFPGGHVEKGEILQMPLSVKYARRLGLRLRTLFCGIYHWNKSGTHHVIFLYKADQYSGILHSSEEGKVYWIPMNEFKEKELATGMEYVLQMMDLHR